MKYDFASFVLQNQEDTAMKTSDTDTSPWTAQKALRAALLADNQENQPSKVARYDLFLKMKTHTLETEYDLEEVALLKKAALTMPAVFAGQLSHLLDQKS